MNATITNDLIEEDLRRRDMEMADKLELMLSGDEEDMSEGDEIFIGIDNIPSMRKALSNAYDNGDITADEVCSFWFVIYNENVRVMDHNLDCLRNIAHEYHTKTQEGWINGLSLNIVSSHFYLNKIVKEIEFAEELVREEKELVEKERIIRDLRELVAEGLVQDCGGGTYKLRETENN